MLSVQFMKKSVINEKTKKGMDHYATLNALAVNSSRSFLCFQRVPKRLRELSNHSVSHVVLSQRMSRLEFLLAVVSSREHTSAIVNSRRSELDLFSIQCLVDLHFQISFQLCEGLHGNPFQLKSLIPIAKARATHLPLGKVPHDLSKSYERHQINR